VTFSLACVQVQARPAASGDGDMAFGPSQGPQEARVEGRSEGGCEGVAPVLKSRDPHLAGGEKVSYKSTNINKQSTKQTKITQQTNHTLGIPEVHIPKDVMSPHGFPFRFND